MKTTKRTKITFETHESTVISFRQRRTIVFCRQCGLETPHSCIAETTAMTDISEPAIPSQLKNKKTLGDKQNEH
jgi:hypothetical protein